MSPPTQQINPLLQIIQSQLDEIMVYKWIESEKAGRDIGWECANQEWTDKHFSAWKRNQWNDTAQDALKPG